ncbi:MAG: hypothetical protein LUF30_08345 [Lachnospiraceae bacterium]|nr:hypothetical protein [Lachnospiraceae bacterium]
MLKFRAGMMADEELLSLEVSLNSYLVLRESLSFCPDVSVYEKIIEEYLWVLPLHETAKVLELAALFLQEKKYIYLLKKAFVH